ncbi:hypothetical protein niasHT_013176 [Heterodera trifolii]|uniref:Uncharacterized protein n=1 Tax=Heterodera trifolii TaxID=157864 RepID=A0ABD2KUH7_9BILA
MKRFKAAGLAAAPRIFTVRRCAHFSPEARQTDDETPRGENGQKGRGITPDDGGDPSSPQQHTNIQKSEFGALENGESRGKEFVFAYAFIWASEAYSTHKSVDRLSETLVKLTYSNLSIRQGLINRSLETLVKLTYSNLSIRQGLINRSLCSVSHFYYKNVKW